MDNTIALAAAAVVLILIIVLVSVLKKQLVPGGNDVGELKRQADQEVAAAPAARRAVAVRNRLRNRLAQRVEHSDDEDERAGGDDHEEEDAAPLIDLSDLGKVGKKKLAKLEAKAEKKAAREAEEREREEQKKKELEQMNERRLKEEQEAQLEKEKEEQLKREIEERERQEHEAYLQLKASFIVEEQGYDAEETVEENLLQRFTEYVQTSKIVLLEELAANFQLKTQDAIDRLQKLVNEGVLTGVIDDRGKFIYISHEEMQSVARFIRQRGRVSISDLVESSNQLIELAAPKKAVAVN
nr:EOG090X0N9E [Leptodora kindtii]